MVRPKASDRNKQIATCFANTITIDVPRVGGIKNQLPYAPVPCKGPWSIYEVLAACLPNVVRETSDGKIKNRKGVSEIELNKTLVSLGFESFRRRMWNDDKVLWHREWYGLRWVDFSNIHDVVHVKRHLHMLQQFPEAKSLTINTLMHVLVQLHDKSSITSSIGYGMCHASPADEETLSSSPDSACALMGRSLNAWRVLENRIEVDGSAADQSTSQTTGMRQLATCQLDLDCVPALVLEDDLHQINSVHVESSLLDDGICPDSVKHGAQDKMACSETVSAPFALAMSPCDTPSLMSSWEMPVRPEASRLQSAVRRECQEEAQPAKELENFGFLLMEPSIEATATKRDKDSIAPMRPGADSPVATEQHGHLSAHSHDIPLLHLAAQHGWDHIELRRLYTFGYSAEPVWRLLASLPPSLRSVILDAADAARPPASGPHAMLSGGDGCDAWDEARGMFSAAEERMRQAMEEDGEVGYLEVAFDPASQLRTHVFLNDRYAAIRGASRQELLSRFADHAVELPSTEPDLLAALLHGLLRCRDAECTQYVRLAGAGGRGALVWEHSRKRYDERGRVVKVRCCSFATERAKGVAVLLRCADHHDVQV